MDKLAGLEILAGSGGQTYELEHAGCDHRVTFEIEEVFSQTIGLTVQRESSADGEREAGYPPSEQIDAGVVTASELAHILRRENSPAGRSACFILSRPEYA